MTLKLKAWGSNGVTAQITKNMGINDNKIMHNICQKIIDDGNCNRERGYLTIPDVQNGGEEPREDMEKKGYKPQNKNQVNANTHLHDIFIRLGNLDAKSPDSLQDRRIRNVVLTKNASHSMDGTSDICTQGTLAFFEHVVGGSHSLEKLIIIGRMEGNRSRGRMAMRWAYAVGEITGKKMQANIHLAQNRAPWRAVVARVTVTITSLSHEDNTKKKPL
nr:uncharacterized protein LOC116774271 [Danaus plexippus plexippus]